MTLELNDGSIIAPLNVFDVLDTVEEYIGVETRQYLENYFLDDNPWDELSDDERYENLQEHYEDILGSIESLVTDSNRLMHMNPVKRKQVIENLENILKMIEREKHGKEDL